MFGKNILGSLGVFGHGIDAQCPCRACVSMRQQQMTQSLLDARQRRFEGFAAYLPPLDSLYRWQKGTLANIFKDRRTASVGFEGRATRARPWLYWQFKNGEIGVLCGAGQPYFDFDEVPVYKAWDRSLGAFVAYSR